MKKIALACTGGGVKACVNIGVLRALDELGIEIEAISGTSLGSLVAYLYTCGYTPQQILEEFEKEVIKFQKFSFIDIIGAIPRLIIFGGLKNPRIITEYVRKIEEKTNIKTLTDVKGTLIIPALDISSRRIICYSSKPLEEKYKYYCNRKVSEAIRSSSAVPLFFTPNKVVINGENHYMLDGGIQTNTLISPLKQFSDYTIGITNKFYPKQRRRVNLFTGFTQTFQAMRKSYLAIEKEKADLWIEIDEKTNRFIAKKNEAKHFEELRL